MGERLSGRTINRPEPFYGKLSSILLWILSRNVIHHNFASNPLNEKPLLLKTYNKIPHFSKSRLGRGDHFIDKNTEKACLSQVPNNQTLIIVQEKLDGSNVCVASTGSGIVALGRSGYLCKDSDQLQHRAFAAWVEDNLHRFQAILYPGERIVGEWLLMAHGTKYSEDYFDDPGKLFVPFDLFTLDNVRLNYHDFLLRILPQDFTPPTLIHMGGACSIERATRLLTMKIRPAYHTKDGHEGLIYRIEKAGIAGEVVKFVRHDKIDGKYCIDETRKWVGQDHLIYHFDPDLC